MVVVRLGESSTESKLIKRKCGGEWVKNGKVGMGFA